MDVQVNSITCKRCGHTWIPRKSDVRTCPNPKCRSVYFDREKDIPEMEPKPKLKKLKGLGGTK